MFNLRYLCRCSIYSLAYFLVGRIHFPNRIAWQSVEEQTAKKNSKRIKLMENMLKHLALSYQNRNDNKQKIFHMDEFQSNFKCFHVAYKRRWLSVVVCLLEQVELILLLFTINEIGSECIRSGWKNNRLFGMGNLGWNLSVKTNHFHISQLNVYNLFISYFNASIISFKIWPELCFVKWTIKSHERERENNFI